MHVNIILLMLSCSSSLLRTASALSTSQSKVAAPAAPFGTLLGVHRSSKDVGVPVYSSDERTAPSFLLSKLSGTVLNSGFDYSSYLNGTYCGMKWQCVELARRYLLITRGLVFDDVRMAYNIYALKSLRRVSDGQLFRMDAHDNGSSLHPRVGSLLIWKPKGFFKVTGHVAVISAVHSDSIEIIEQNVEDAVWPDGINYSRILKTETALDGSFTIHCTYNNTIVLGWMNHVPAQEGSVDRDEMR